MNIAIILMAGKGERAETTIPKQYIIIDEKPIYEYCLLQFYRNKNIDKIILVTDNIYYDKVKDYISLQKYDNKCEVTIGGKSRKESVLNALIYLGNKIDKEDIVLVHDSARPLVDETIINDNIKVASCNKIAVTAIKATSTLVEIDTDNKSTKNYLDRSKIMEIQTPQYFKFSKFLKVSEYYREKSEQTDDSQIFFKAGEKLEFVKGNCFNFKITTMEDIKLFMTIMNSKM